MKYALYLFLMLVSLISVRAQGIDFLDGDFDEALAAAAGSNKLVFVDAYTVWCGPCKRMSRQIFPQDTVGAYFNPRFISVKLNMEKGTGIAFANKYAVSSYPTMLFFTADGELIRRVVGAKPAADLLAEAARAVAQADDSDRFAKRYEEGQRDAQTVLAYIRSLRRADKPFVGIANQYFREHDSSDPTALPILWESIVQVDSRLFALFIDQRAALEKTYGRPAVEEKILAAAEKTLSSGIRYNREQLIKEAKTAVEEHLPERASLFSARADLSLARAKNDANAAGKAAQRYVKASNGVPSEADNMALELIRYYPEDRTAIRTAAGLVADALRREQTFERHYLYARILHLQDKNAKARTQLQLARQFVGDPPDSGKQRKLDELEKRIREQ